MIWKDHSKLAGLHAFLGASKYSWLGYSDEKLIETYMNAMAVEQGTIDHSFAATCIERKQKLAGKSNLAQYVNDAIGFRMTPEQTLYYSDNCFGTADAIAFDKKFLRIHDLKTGKTPAKFDQLVIYAALFCLEYNVNPEDIQIELRIYQMGEIKVHIPESQDVRFVMGKIISADTILNQLKDNEGIK